MQTWASVVARISNLFIARCRISVASLFFLNMRLSSERKHLSITDFTARYQKNYSCALGMTISDSDSFLMAESSILWVVLSDINNKFSDWELLMGFQVWIT